MGAESSFAAQPCARACSCVPILCPDLDPLSWGALLLGEGKARVTEEEKEKNEREKKASKATGSFFSFMRVSLIL